jgi:hypothetical protein
MSYALKTTALIGDSTIDVYFGSWAKNKTPVTVETLRYARKWKEKTNCKRFYNRNKGILGKYNYEIFRVIEDRYCQYCSILLDPEMNSGAKFCTDECRNKSFRD